MSNNPIRIFVASPGDVAQERKVAFQVIEQIQYRPEFQDRVRLEPVGWDVPGSRVPLFATDTPQKTILENATTPAQCDVVLVMFWKRMGMPLPTDVFEKPDGTAYLSGTEWEYWNAFEAHQKWRKPEILVYRRSERVSLDPLHPNFDSDLAQFRAVEQFFTENFYNADGSAKGGFHHYETPDDFRALLEENLTQVVRQLLVAEQETTVDLDTWEGSPFPGLRALTQADEAIFFGRGRETDEVMKLVEQNRFVAVVGASGSGKSSLVGAGLLTRLAANGLPSSDKWRVFRFTPGGSGTDPFDALAEQIAPELETTQAELADLLIKDPSRLQAICEPYLQDEGAEILFFIDQFEELFTLVQDETVRLRFVDLLTEISHSQRLRAVVTMRSDFYHYCVAIPTLARLFEGAQFPLSVPNLFQLRDMIERPAERAKLELEGDLVEQIVRDTGSEPGSLALMAYALDELYKNRDANGRLTFDTYHNLGSVKGAIGKRAKAIFDALEQETQDAFQQVFRELVEIDKQGVATRRRADLKSLRQNLAARRLVDKFIAARLLTTDGAMVEVAHEALFNSWELLQQWIAEHRSDFQLWNQARNAVKEWVDADKKKYFLWPHERLREVYNTLDRLEIEPDDPDLQFFLKPEYERLEEELNDPKTLDYRRQAIGDRLADIGVPALPVLERTFNHPDKWLRAVAVKSLIQIGEPAVPLLLKFLADGDENVNRRAQRALAAIGVLAIPELVSTLRRHDVFDPQGVSESTRETLQLIFADGFSTQRLRRCTDDEVSILLAFVQDDSLYNTYFPKPRYYRGRRDQFDLKTNLQKEIERRGIEIEPRQLAPDPRTIRSTTTIPLQLETVETVSFDKAIELGLIDMGEDVEPTQPLESTDMAWLDEPAPEIPHWLRDLTGNMAVLPDEEGAMAWLESLASTQGANHKSDEEWPGELAELPDWLRADDADSEANDKDALATNKANVTQIPEPYADLQAEGIQQRIAAAIKIGESKSPEAVPYLIMALESARGEYFRVVVIDALKKIGTPEALKAIEDQ